MNAVEKRDALLGYIRSQFIGPHDGEEKVDPVEYYSAGILYPLDRDNTEKDVLFSDNEYEDGDSTDMEPDLVSTLSSIIEPASMGIEAVVEDLDDLDCVEISFARYKKEEGCWVREPMKILLKSEEIRDGDQRLPGNSGYLRIIIRTVETGKRIRIFIVNDMEAPLKLRDSNYCLFQPEIKIRTRNGRPGFLAMTDRFFQEQDLEERQIRMRFRKKKIYAAPRAGNVRRFGLNTCQRS